MLCPVDLHFYICTLYMYTLCHGILAGFDPEPSELFCEADDPLAADHRPFLCVDTENSAVLGLFRQDTPATRSRSEFNELSEAFAPEFSFE